MFGTRSDSVSTSNRQTGEDSASTDFIMASSALSHLEYVIKSGLPKPPPAPREFFLQIPTTIWNRGKIISSSLLLSPWNSDGQCRNRVLTLEGSIHVVKGSSEGRIITFISFFLRRILNKDTLKGSRIKFPRIHSVNKTGTPKHLQTNNIFIRNL